MRVGVIGTGIMGRNHIRVYNEMKSVDTIYVYDIDKKASSSIEESYEQSDGNVYACDSIDSLIDTVDAISVCVPTQYHKNTVEKIVQFDKEMNILIEKPICSTFNESNDLLETLNKNRNKVVYGVGHIERFNPIIPELKKIIENPLYVEFKRHNPASTRITDTNVVEDLMIHDIDVMRELFCASPTSMYGFGNNDIYTATITLESLPICLSASRKSSKKIRSIYVETEEFTVEGNYISQEITIYSKPGRYQSNNGRYLQENIVEKLIVNKVEPLRKELDTFIDCIIHNTPFPVSVNDAVNNMLICSKLQNNQITTMQEE